MSRRGGKGEDRKRLASKALTPGVTSQHSKNNIIRLLCENKVINQHLLVSMSVSMSFLII